MYLLCGLPGSGKTTHADDLVTNKSVTKISVDDEMLKKFGIIGKDYDASKHQEYKAEIMKDIKLKIADLVSAGNSLVLDFGVWKQKDRIYFRNLISENGGVCRLVYFKAGKPTLLERLNIRNNTENGSNVTITEKMLDEKIALFEEPHDEGEIIITQNS